MDVVLWSLFYLVNVVIVIHDCRSHKIKNKHLVILIFIELIYVATKIELVVIRESLLYGLAVLVLYMLVNTLSQRMFRIKAVGMGDIKYTISLSFVVVGVHQSALMIAVRFIFLSWVIGGVIALLSKMYRKFPVERMGRIPFAPAIFLASEIIRNWPRSYVLV
jgi:Flp pilus assembly protein protease CpaA